MMRARESTTRQGPQKNFFFLEMVITNFGTRLIIFKRCKFIEIIIPEMFRIGSDNICSKAINVEICLLEDKT